MDAKVVGGNGYACPRCGRRVEMMIETYDGNGMRRRTFLYKCVCGWRKEIETAYITRRDGKIVVKHVRQ